MKKALLIVFAVLIAFSLLLSSCGREEEAATEEEEREVAEGPQYKIGICFDVGGRGDKSFNDSAYRGLRQVAEEYNGFIAGDPDDVDYGQNLELKYMEPKEGGQDR